MSTYRTGNHHGVTIVDENPNARCGRPGHDCARGHLVAVVVDGGEELAERICALLNGAQALADSDGFCPGHGTPDRTYLRGASEALAEVRRRMIRQYPALSDATSRIIRDAAAELGIGEHGHQHAPGTPPHSHGAVR